MLGKPIFYLLKGDYSFNCLNIQRHVTKQATVVSVGDLGPRVLGSVMFRGVCEEISQDVLFKRLDQEPGMGLIHSCVGVCGSRLG